MSEFTLHYHISNQGDGSAALRLHDSHEAAKQADDDQNEGGDGWAEPSVGGVVLKVEDGKLYRRTRDYSSRPAKTVWVELTPTNPVV